MKKSLIALAVLAVSGMASAQSTVTLYGLVDTYVGSIKSGGTTQTVVNSGGLNGSRFGFKGSEDLGGGLKANFLLEGGFGSDTGASGGYDSVVGNVPGTNLFSRQSYVGLSGGFGEIKIGKTWTAYDDLTGTGIAGFGTSIFMAPSGVWKSFNYNDNPGNTIYYATPDFSGVTAAASYSLGENKNLPVAGVKAGSVASFNVAYAGGPVFVGFAYQTEKPTGNATAAKFTQINASYDLGVAKLLGAYGNVKDSGGVPKTTEFQIGVDVPVSSALTLTAGYARSKDDAPSVTRKGFGLAGLYALSKRTNLYAGFQQAKDPSAASTKSNVYAAGIRHTF